MDEQKNGNIKTSLLTLIDEAGNDINKARANIEGWYNDAMDRVSGWYKRRVHWILMVIGLLAAGFLNIDTITVTRTLWYDDTLRKSVATAADTYVKGNQPSPTPAPNDTAKPEDQAKDALKRVKEVQIEINSLGLPIGWIYEPKADDPKYADDKGKEQYQKDIEAYKTDPRRFPNDPTNWFLKVLGILFTALAVSQGAPFWFDLLNKFIVIRSTVKPREKSQEQPSKDKPAPETSKAQIEDKDKDK